METEYFTYGTTEIAHLSACDERLARAIEQIGMIKRPVRPDLFSALMNTVIGQQISTKAQATIWQRLKDCVVAVTPENIIACDDETLQHLGISSRKVSYMKGIAEAIVCGNLSLSALHDMDDDEVIAMLSQLRGIGVWSAEMLLLFALQRQDVLSYGDLAIQRGLRMLYGHQTISSELFSQYRQRYSPYGSVASLYLWAIAGGAIADWCDPASQKNVDTIACEELPESSRSVARKVSGMRSPLTPRPDEYVMLCNSNFGQLAVGSDGTYITSIQFVNAGDMAMTDDAIIPAKAQQIIQQAIDQIAEYSAGERRQFDLPLRQEGTEFQQSVWRTLQNIPYAETVSYKSIAECIGSPHAYRAVGMANNKNRIAIVIPCHRVVGSNGKMVGYAGGICRKQQMLELESRVAMNMNS